MRVFHRGQPYWSVVSYVAHNPHSADYCSTGRHRPGISQSDVFHDAVHHQHNDSVGV